MSSKNNNWQPLSWYCPACGTKVSGYKNKESKVKMKCSCCDLEIIANVESRRFVIFDLFSYGIYLGQIKMTCGK